ncbi:MAG: gamma-glutamylcyclotransferase [Bacteroidetes bacterium]|nr:gamma-glutamylcyclotransferase [Bacteroidota bacterium]MBS1931704.1 gamma-glutamylcyclotransferase [Bacteroidota bacterium]
MSDPGIYQLFVYGTLRSGFKSAAYEYISRYFTLKSEAKVRGKLFDMGSYPAGVPSKDNTFITGELFVAKGHDEFHWAISQLDDYEGVNVEPDEMQLYRRELTEVYLNNSITHAWIYWYNGDISGRPLVASGDLISYLQHKR